MTSAGLRWPLIVLALLALAHAAHADRQLWLESGVEASATKRLELDLGAELRFDQDASRMDKLLANGGVGYRWKKWLRTGAGYRLEYERDNMAELVLRHRLAADVRLRYEHEPLRVDFRAMLFEQIRPASNDQLRTGMRNRIQASYHAWRPWAPSAGIEVFHRLGDLDRLEYDKTRFTVGGSYGRSDHDVELLLRVEQHADPNEPTYFILALGYHYQVQR